MSVLSSQVDELREAAGRFEGYQNGEISLMLRESADTIEGLATALEDVLRNAGDTIWVGKAETLVDRMVALGIYGHEVYEGARPWEVKR